MLTNSLNLDESFVAKDFNLKSVDGKYYNINQIRGNNGTLIFFICNHCPYVKDIAKKLERDTSELRSYGVNSVGIMSNDFHAYPVRSNFILPLKLQQSVHI